MGGEWLDGKLFGEGSDGQKWMMLGGSLAGGFMGAKGGSALGSKFIPNPTSATTGFVKGGVPGVRSINSPVPKFKTTKMSDHYEGENIPGNKIWSSQVKYLNDAELAQHKINIKDGRLYDSKGVLYDTGDAATAHSGGGRSIYVMDEAGNIYASKYQEPGLFHHSSLSRAKPVAAAGEIEVAGGKLTAISDKSGHYRPTREFSDQAVSHLSEQGIDMSGVKLDFIGGH